jgi:GAF domain-containing protein
MTEQSREIQLMALMVKFARTMVTDYTAESALDELMQAVPSILEVDGAGIMLEDDHGELRFVSASNDTIRLIEEFQVQTGEGPCVMAFETGRHVRTGDLAGETPFPAFAEVALASGLKAVHSFPMLLEDTRVGAMNLYRSTSGPLPADGEELGQVFADIATTYLFSARTEDRLSKQIAGLRDAIEHNGVLDQAKGVLMHTYGLQDREAFSVLRRQARANRQRVIELAQSVMDGDAELSRLIDQNQLDRP